VWLCIYITRLHLWSTYIVFFLPPLMPQLLPDNPYNINTNPSEHDAYAMCVAYETRAITGLHPVPSGVTSLVCTQLLGYMMLCALTNTGHENISNKVQSCTNSEQLADMAKLYIKTFLYTCSLKLCKTIKVQKNSLVHVFLMLLKAIHHWC